MLGVLFVSGGSSCVGQGSRCGLLAECFYSLVERFGSHLISSAWILIL